MAEAVAAVARGFTLKAAPNQQACPVPSDSSFSFPASLQLRQLCQRSSSLDVSTACGPHGRTALHAAAEAGCAAACRTLLDLGADTYCADDNGVSPLMMAAAGGHTDAVKVHI